MEKQNIVKGTSPSNQLVGTYHGWITVYESGRMLWNERSPITRLTRAEALADAEELARSLAPEAKLKH